MTKYHSIQGQINDEMVQQIKTILNDPDCHNHIVFFTSGGGFTAHKTVILGMLRDYYQRDGNELRVVFHSEVASAAFDLLFELPENCARYVPENIIGMTHLHRMSMEMASNGLGWTRDDDARMEFVKSLHEPAMERAKRMGMTDDEIRRMHDTQDVYFSIKRMIELLEFNNIKAFT